MIPVLKHKSILIRPDEEGYDKNYWAAYGAKSLNSGHTVIRGKVDWDFNVPEDHDVVSFDSIYYEGVRDAVYANVLKGRRAHVVWICYPREAKVGRYLFDEGKFVTTLQEGRYIVEAHSHGNGRAYIHPIFNPFITEMPSETTLENGVTVSVKTSVGVGGGAYMVYAVFLKGEVPAPRATTSFKQTEEKLETRI